MFLYFPSESRCQISAVFPAVGNSNSNKGQGEKMSLFSFPKSEQQISIWLRKIHRTDYTASKNSFICEKHFEEKFII